jgi:rhamnose utilization protein RhaD (predicted bifunctional aldolase and dehydrogenase)
MSNRDLNQTKSDIIDFCCAVGKDPLYVQGAGGNVSWKENDTLWIKASGTWLINAGIEDIFLPVELNPLQEELKNENFKVTPNLKNNSKLRPSIETILHALMPHKVVVHLHAVEILAHLVKLNCLETMNRLIPTNIKWKLVDYHKPGAELAKAVSHALSQEPKTDIIFLKSHGVVIGGKNINEVKKILEDLTKALKIKPRLNSHQPTKQEKLNGYSIINNTEIQQLALDKNLFYFVASNWALYPDHVVFLGAKANIYKTIEEFQKNYNQSSTPSEIIFILDSGVYSSKPLSQAMLEQLQCYFNVIVRQDVTETLSVLSTSQISELIDWDSEKYRKTISK